MKQGDMHKDAQQDQMKQDSLSKDQGKKDKKSNIESRIKIKFSLVFRDQS